MHSMAEAQRQVLSCQLTCGERERSSPASSHQMKFRCWVAKMTQKMLNRSLLILSLLFSSIAQFEFMLFNCSALTQHWVAVQGAGNMEKGATF